jgi:hypothetical protein
MGIIGDKTPSRKNYIRYSMSASTFTIGGFINFGGGVAFGPTDINPGKMTVQGLGADIRNLMRLVTIPEEYIAPIALQLK